MDGYWTGPNSRYPRCVDSRPVDAIAEWCDGAWRIVKRGEDAGQELGPQLPGGSLVFVRALEVVGGRGRWRAFDLVERAAQDAGLGLQIHLDDDAGRRDLSVMRDDALVALVQQQVTGCGFAAAAWERHAHMIVNEAKRRHWRVLFVDGTTPPRGAWVNLRAEETFDTTAAARAGTPHFNLDVDAARPVFAVLETLIRQSGFAEQAETWMIETYGELVLALGAPGVTVRE